jgi:SNF2 family DNA or RNA helicase
MKVIRINKADYGIVSERFSPTLRDVCRETPGMARGAYHVDDDHRGNAWIGYPDAVEAVIQTLHEKGMRLDTSALPKPGDYGQPAIPVAWKHCRDYQKVGVRFLLDQGPTGALLADVMGLGKSLQAILAARALKNKTVIVCPSHARGVWARYAKPERGESEEATAQKPGELQKWWPAARIVCLPEGIRPFTPLIKPKKTPTSDLEAHFRPKPVYNRHPSVDMAAQIVVIHYDILYAWVDTLLEWGVKTLIVDEAHALVNYSSRRSQAVAALAEVATCRIALTGTPLPNRPRDLWNLIETLSPGRFGKFFHFGLRFCNGHKEEVTKDKIVWKFDGTSNEAELNARLKHFMLRRTTAEVALELPPLTRQIIDVEIPAKGRMAVTSVVASSPVAMRKCLDLAADAKLEDAIQIALNDAQEGHRVVVFTYRRSVAEHTVNAMRLAGVPADMIRGGTPQRQRDRIIDAVSGQPSHVLAATIDSVSTAIDLSYADVGIFFELSWEPQKLAQAEKRLHRHGATRPVVIKYIIARGTGDELVLDTVINKLGTFEAMIGSAGDGLRGDLDNSEKGMGALNALYERIVQQEAAKAAAAKRAKWQKKKAHSKV